MTRSSLSKGDLSPRAGMRWERLYKPYVHDMKTSGADTKFPSWYELKRTTVFEPAANSIVCLLASPAVVLSPFVSQAADMISLTYLKSAGSVPFGEASVVADAWPNAVHNVVERNNAHVSDMALPAEFLMS